MFSMPPRRSPFHRERSISRERSRGRSYSGDDDHHSDSYPSDYSDDFEPDARSRQRTPPRQKRRNENPRRHGQAFSDYQSTATSDLHSSSSKKTVQSVGRRTYVKSKRTHGRRSKYSERDTRPSFRPDAITSRLLSAKQRKINDIQNELSETEQRLQDVSRENKLLKTVQFRQDKALRRFQDVESDLPRLISQNFEEQKVLKTRLRKAQHAEKQLEEKLRENNDEMQKMEKTLRKLKQVVYDKNLGERSDLARQLTNTENELSVADRKVKELEKKLELTTNSYTRQIKTERQKHKETKNRLETLVEEHESVILKLKEKERALGVSNIYSLRNKESSINSTPRKQKDVPVSSRFQYANQIKDKSKKVVAIEFEKDDKPVPHAKQSLPSPSPPSPTPVPRSPISRRVEKKDEANGIPSLPRKPVANEKENVFLTSSFQSESPASTRPVDSIDFNKSDQESGDINRTTSPRSSRSFMEAKSDDDSFNEIMNRKAKEKEAEKQRKLKEEEEEFKLRQEMLEKEKVKQEQKRLEDQKKKAALLAKMRDIEKEEDSPRSPLGSMHTLSLTDTSKPIQPPDERSTKHTTSFENNQRSKAERVRSLFGSETDPVVENLHLGIPTTTKRLVDQSESELSFGGYAPSAVGSEHARKPRVSNKKSGIVNSDSDTEEPLFDLNSGKPSKDADLLSQLFGDRSKPDKNSVTEQKADDSSTPRAKPIHSGYPWEKNVVTSNQANSGANPSYKVKTGFQVKGSTPIQDDDIEELSL